jgi:hypothetical protein
VAAWVPDRFCNFYLVKTHKIANNSTTTEARKNINIDSESLEFCKFIDVGFTKFKKVTFYLIKLSTDFYRQPRYSSCKTAPLKL